MSAPPVSRPEDRSRLVTTTAGRVFVADRGPLHGETPPLVLVHGLLVTSHSFRGVVPRMATSRRVIALDLPGCGESDRPDPRDAEDYAVPWIAARVLEALHAMDVTHFDLCGHSFGGTVALQLASEAPDAVRRLALVDPVAFSMELPLEGRLALLPRLGPYVFKTLYRRADLRRYLTRVFSTPELVDDTSVALYWDRLARDGGREATHAMLLHLTRLEALRDRIRTIETPTLVVWGDRDALLPADQADALLELLPNARLELVAGCGHAVPEERPDRLSDLLEAFLDDAGPARARP